MSLRELILAFLASSVAVAAAVAPHLSCSTLAQVGLHAHDDLANIDAKTLDMCCNFCSATPGCVAWTLNEGMCRAKGAKALDPAIRVACDTCTSGFLPTPTPAPTPPTPPSPPTPPATKPHILFVLQDDMGWNDVGFNNAAMKPVTSNLTALARGAGIRLTNHLVHFHCSPTRRSFLTGRLPIHHGENLSETDADDMDLRWALISDKLKSAGYATHWVG